MKRSTQADIAFLFIVVLWGSAFALAKGALDYITPILFVIVRFLLAGAIWFILFGSALRKMKAGTWRRGIILGTVLGGGFVLQTVGLDITRASMSGFLTGLSVVIVPFLVIFVERKIPRITSLAGVIICTLGLYLLTSPTGAGFNTGDLFTIGAAFLFALYIVLVEVYTSEYDTRALTLIQVAGILLVAIPATFIFESPAVTLNWSLVWRCLALGTMAAVTLALQIYWQRYISATRAAVIITLETPLAAFFAFLFLGEILTGAAYTGGGLIFLGMVVAEGGARLIPSSSVNSV